MNKQRTNNKWIVFALSLACTCVLTLSGCGDDEDNGDEKEADNGGESGQGGERGNGDDSEKSGNGGEDGKDDNVDKDGASGSGDEKEEGGSGETQGCPDHPNVEESDTGSCYVSAPDTEPMVKNLTMDADNTWYLDGAVFVGDDEKETVLTIEAGTTIYGGDGSVLVIQRSSKIMAEGTADKPIVMTSAKEDGERGPEDWGGLVINGRAPINHSDKDDDSAPGEAGTGRYGGDDEKDNSGVLKYVIVEFAGNKIDAENELNGIAFQGVGNGTEVDYIQTHMNSDDGIEFFGGTVNVKHAVITASDDDSVDWMGGFSGKIQFVVIEQFEDSGPEAERGIEADNYEDNNSATPFSNPTLSNFTIIARKGNEAEGIRLRRGTKGKLSNFVVTGFEGPCVKVTEVQTGDNVDDKSLVMTNSVLNCEGGAAADTLDGDDPDADTDDLAADATNMIDAGDNEQSDPKLDGWIPKSDSPALGIGNSPDDSFFESVDYAGAFDGEEDWTDGWIHTALD